MKKRLLFVNGHLNTGGVEKSLVDLLNSLDYEKYEVDLLLLEGVGEYLELVNQNVRIIKYDITSTYGNFKYVLEQSKKQKSLFPLCLKLNFYFAYKNKKNDFYYAKRLFPLMEYDVAIAYRIGYSCEFIIDVVKAKKKIVWWHHGSCDYPESMMHKIAQEFAQCDQVITVSNGIKQMLTEYFSHMNFKIKVIPNMIDRKNILKKAQEKIEDQFSEKVFHILSVGRLSREKNYELAIEVAKVLKDNNIKFCWRIIGDGEMRETLANKIAEEHLEKQVILLGSLKNPYPYYKNSDIFVHTSIVESQSIVVLEALTFELPTVVVKSIGPMEFLKDGVNGYLVENDKSEMVDRILKIFDGHSFEKEELRNTVEKFSVQKVSEKFECIVTD